MSSSDARQTIENQANNQNQLSQTSPHFDEMLNTMRHIHNWQEMPESVSARSGSANGPSDHPSADPLEVKKSQETVGDPHHKKHKKKIVYNYNYIVGSPEPTPLDNRDEPSLENPLVAQPVIPELVDKVYHRIKDSRNRPHMGIIHKDSDHKVDFSGGHQVHDKEGPVIHHANKDNFELSNNHEINKLEHEHIDHPFLPPFYRLKDVVGDPREFGDQGFTENQRPDFSMSDLRNRNTNHMNNDMANFFSDMNGQNRNTQGRNMFLPRQSVVDRNTQENNMFAPRQPMGDMQRPFSLEKWMHPPEVEMQASQAADQFMRNYFSGKESDSSEEDEPDFLEKDAEASHHKHHAVVHTTPVHFGVPAPPVYPVHQPPIHGGIDTFGHFTPAPVTHITTHHNPHHLRDAEDNPESDFNINPQETDDMLNALNDQPGTGQGNQNLQDEEDTDNPTEQLDMIVQDIERANLKLLEDSAIEALKNVERFENLVEADINRLRSEQGEAFAARQSNNQGVQHNFLHHPRPLNEEHSGLRQVPHVNSHVRPHTHSRPDPFALGPNYIDRFLVPHGQLQNAARLNANGMHPSSFPHIGPNFQLQHNHQTQHADGVIGKQEHRQHFGRNDQQFNQGFMGHPSHMQTHLHNDQSRHVNQGETMESVMKKKSPYLEDRAAEEEGDIAGWRGDMRDASQANFQDQTHGKRPRPNSKILQANDKFEHFPVQAIDGQSPNQEKLRNSGTSSQGVENHNGSLDHNQSGDSRKQDLAENGENQRAAMEQHVPSMRRNHEPQLTSNSTSIRREDISEDTFQRINASDSKQVLIVNETHFQEAPLHFPKFMNNATKIPEEDVKLRATNTELPTTDVDDAVFKRINSSSDRDVLMVNKSTFPEPPTVFPDFEGGILRKTFSLIPTEFPETNQERPSESRQNTHEVSSPMPSQGDGIHKGNGARTSHVVEDDEGTQVSSKVMSEMSGNKLLSSRQNGMDDVERVASEHQTLSGNQANEDMFRPILQPKETIVSDVAGSSRRKRAAQVAEASETQGEYSPKNKSEHIHTDSNAQELVMNPNIPSPKDHGSPHDLTVNERNAASDTDDALQSNFHTKSDPTHFNLDLVRSPHLFQVPVQRDSFFNSEYFRQSRSTETNDKDSRKINRRYVRPNEHTHIFSNLCGKLLNVKSRPEEARISEGTHFRRKRGVSVSRLIVDPTVKLDVPKTIQNLGTATKNAFEDQRKPLYHVRNLLGSTKNAFMSAMSIPPQNFIVPSNYKIDKIEDEDSVAKILNSSQDQVGAINHELLSRMKGTRSRNRVSEDAKTGAEEDPFEIMDTFHRIGAVLRESVKSGQDTLKHIGDVAQDTRNIFYTARHSTPRIEIPYTRVNPLRSKPRFNPSGLRRKAVVYTPHILDIEHARGIEKNPLDSRPDFVKLGQIMDAVGVTKGKDTDLDVDKITLEAMDKPTPRLTASLSSYHPARINKPDMKTMLQDIRALNEAKKEAGAKTLREFLDNVKSRMGNIDKRLPWKNNLKDNFQESTTKGFDDDLKDHVKTNSDVSKTYTNVFGRQNSEDEDEELDEFVEGLLTTPVEKEKRAQGSDEEKLEDLEIDTFLDNFVSSSHAAKESAKQRLKSNIQKLYGRKLPRPESSSLTSTVPPLSTKPIKPSRGFLKTRTAEEKIDHEDFTNEITKEKLTPKGDTEEHIVKKRSADDFTPVVEPVLITNLKHHQDIEQGKKTPRLFISNIEESVQFPGSEELVGASLMVDPQMLKPFMGRASEDDVQKFIKEVDARYSSGRRNTPQDLSQGQLDHVLGAINPLMFEELFNRTLNGNEDIPNRDAGHDGKGEEVLGVMQMTGRFLQPFMGMVPDDAVTDFLDYYNPQEFDFTSVREDINDRPADYE